MFLIFYYFVFLYLFIVSDTGRDACCVVLCGWNVQAEGLVLSLRDLFQAVFDIKKKQEAEASSGDAGEPETEVKSESDENQVTQVQCQPSL